MLHTYAAHLEIGGPAGISINNDNMIQIMKFIYIYNIENRAIYALVTLF